MALKLTYRCPKKCTTKTDIHIRCERCPTCNKYLELIEISEA